MRGNQKRLVTFLATLAFIVYILLPTVALLALHVDVQRERQSRAGQITVPALKGLSYENAEMKLHASNLNIRLSATRSDLLFSPDWLSIKLHNPAKKSTPVTLLL